MKRFCILSASLFLFSLITYSQGVNQLWGIVQNGGTDGIGVIFSTNAVGNNFQVRHNLKYNYPGANPVNTNLVEYNGKFYGMTGYGGSINTGLIFEWDPATNTYSKKIDLSTGSNGLLPKGSLTFSGGKFYGMTSSGGINNKGVIFEWDPATNLYTKKIDFGTTNGETPYGDLTLSGGKFYGMTLYGGTNNKGVIFEYDPSTNVYTKKIDLSTANGSNPIGSLIFNAGKFYGMTGQGGSNGVGVIFEWDPVTNIYTKKIDLSVTIGSYPQGNLIYVGGKFYGLTQRGGSNDLGVIYEWDSVTNIYTKKIDFSVANGSTPKGNLTLSNGKFYSMTYSGGNNSVGVIFEWDPVSNVYTKKIDLSTTNGSNPYGNIALSGGKFYGMTNSGGSYGGGVIFEWDPATNVYTKKINFLESNGIWSLGELTLIGRKLYGMTTYGGSSDQGVIFEWDLDANTYTKKIDLTASTGYNPVANSIALFGTKLYGTQTLGGANAKGVIFEWDPVTNVYTKKNDFSTTNGSEPWSGMVLYNSKFYGVTSYGGSNNAGALFEWDPLTNVYTKKIDFSGAIGCFPYGGLTLYGGKFYGMTNDCGANGYGEIYEWDPATNVFTPKIGLSTADGKNPYGNLTINAGKFYGMTNRGGANGSGVIFEWDPVTNTYTKKIDLSNSTGSLPYGSLLLSAGKFYGMTNQGGANGLGVVFEWDPVTNVYTVKKNFTGLDGKNPIYGNGLALVSAPVAKGNLVSCETLPTVTIDATNNNTWVPIVDNLGDIAAEINANGNNLGTVSTSLYTKNGTCREDGSNRLYLNRNITITPQTQPGSGNVSVRLYIKKSELDSLRTALNSMGQPSGVASINEVDVFKNDDACSVTGALTALPLTATSGTYNSDYYLQVNVSSFSSFYFANKLLTEILPVKLKSFTGKKVGAVNELKWEASCNASVVFNIERSSDGIHFETIGNVAASDCNAPFYFTDNNPFSKNNFYRLRIKESSGATNYSAVILLDADKAGQLHINVKPNLVKSSFLNVELITEKSETFELLITNVIGRKIQSTQLTMQAGINNAPINVTALAPGIYWLYAVGKEGRSNVERFVKQ
jgi:uncharacterized repeat protein (TIGR03803 family)